MEEKEVRMPLKGVCREGKEKEGEEEKAAAEEEEELNHNHIIYWRVKEERV